MATNRFPCDAARSLGRCFGVCRVHPITRTEEPGPTEPLRSPRHQYTHAIVPVLPIMISDGPMNLPATSPFD